EKHTSESQSESIVLQSSRMEEGEFFYPSLHTAMSYLPEKWVPFLRDLIGNPNRNLHSGAAKSLLARLQKTNNKKLEVEIAQLLLPWLFDAQWAGEAFRYDFIYALEEVELPEAVPGLIHVLETEKESETRAAAARALKKYRDPRAIPALRRLLKTEENEE